LPFHTLLLFGILEIRRDNNCCPDPFAAARHHDYYKRRRGQSRQTIIRWL
jgi:hypothetical protein